MRKKKIAFTETAKSRQTRRVFLGRSMGFIGLLYGINPWRELFASGQNSQEQIAAIKTDSPVKSVIFLNMAGGMSHLDTLDPKADSEVKGPFGSIASSINGARLSDRMPATARELKRLNLIRSVHSKQGDHSRGQFLLHTGHDMQNAFSDSPSFGSIIAFVNRKKRSTYFPDHVTIGGRSGLIGRGGFLGTAFGSFHIANVNAPLQNIQGRHNLPDERMARREKMLDLMNAEFQGRVQGNQIKAWQEMHLAAVDFMNSKELDVFEISKEAQATRQRFGEGTIGKSFLMALRMARAGVPFIEVTVGGFDTHNNNSDRMSKILAELDPALGALTGELGSSGLLKQTLLVLGSEFGRTPRLSSGGDGRDHFPAVWSMLIGGGPTTEGQLYGQSNAKGTKPEKDPVHLRDMVATIYRAAGIDPDGSLKNSMGRPFPLVPDNKVVSDLFS
jgi:uncharacterized protein (DUF1501 family)